MSKKSKIPDFTLPQFKPVTFQNLVHRLYTDKRMLKSMISEAKTLETFPNKSFSSRSFMLEKRIVKTKEDLFEMISSEEFVKLIDGDLDD